MANWKVTYIFNAAAQGWTETFYTTNISANNVGEPAGRLGGLRMLMLGTGANLVAFRISDDAVQGDSTLVRIPPADNVALNVGGTRDFQDTAALGDCYAGDLYRRQLWLRGIPDAWTTYNPTNQQWTPHAVFMQAFNQLAALLVTDPWALKGINKDPVTSKPSIINNVTIDGSRFVFATVAAHGYAVGNTVKVSRVKAINSQYINKTFKIEAVTGTTFSVPHGLTIQTGILYQSGGVAKLLVPTFPKITMAQYNTISGHKTGRAFFVRRGRRQVRR